ncbi:MAG: thioredoxin [Verrucomicrobia bacterium]|nr:MAG: thioredoxin [Verrucomicrobiota bacterium]
MSENIQHLTSDNFKSTVDSSTVPLLVDFWAPWCGPCKAITPILEELAGEMAGKLSIAKVDVDENGEVAAQFNVRAIPTLILFKNGQVAEQFVGLVGKSDLKTKIEQHLG